MNVPWHELAPYLFYAAGSLCFLIGTLIVIVRIVAA